MLILAPSCRPAVLVAVILLGCGLGTAFDVTKSVMFEHGTPNNPVVCSSVTITGSVPLDAFEALHNCSVVEGSVKINILHYNKSAKALLPNVVQVLDSVTLFHVRGLQSVAAILPKLKVVRGPRPPSGREEHVQLTFRLTGNQDLTEIGLPSLSFKDEPSSIVDVRLNWLLCLPATPPWITSRLYGENNGQYCDYDQNGCHYEDKTCTKFALTRCNDLCQSGCTSRRDKALSAPSSADCCHMQCLGGCFDAQDAASCVACRNYVHKGVCVEHCPAGYLEYLGYRCVSWAQCGSFGGAKLKKGLGEAGGPQCVLQCPKNFMLQRPARVSGDNEFLCTNSSDVCGSIVLQGEEGGGSGTALLPEIANTNCRTVQGSIIVRGAINGSRMEALEKLFAQDFVVTDFVQVTETSLMSLDFIFGKLGRIVGRKLFMEKYALYISDNIKLQELISSDDDSRPSHNFCKEDTSSSPNGRRHKLQLDEEKVLFRGNSKLCPTEVCKLMTTQLTQTTHFTLKHNEQNDVNVPCNLSTILVEEINATTNSLEVSWKGNYLGPKKMLLQSYYIYYRLAPEDNGTVKMFQGRDSCNDQRMWQQEQTVNKSTLTLKLSGLMPGRRYALYVEADVLPYFAKGGYDSMHGSRSGIVYCSTKPTVPSRPTHVKVLTDEASDSDGNRGQRARDTNTSGNRLQPGMRHRDRRSHEDDPPGLKTVAVTWSAPSKPGGVLAGYQVLLCPQERDRDQLKALAAEKICDEEQVKRYLVYQDEAEQQQYRAAVEELDARNNDSESEVAIGSQEGDIGSSSSDWCETDRCDAWMRKWMETRRNEDQYRFYMRIDEDLIRDEFRISHEKSSLLPDSSATTTTTSNRSNPTTTTTTTTQSTTTNSNGDGMDVVAGRPSGVDFRPSANDSTTASLQADLMPVCNSKVNTSLFQKMHFDKANNCQLKYVPHIHHVPDTAYRVIFGGLEYFTKMKVSVRACHLNSSQSTGSVEALCSHWANATATAPRRRDFDRVTSLRIDHLTKAVDEYDNTVLRIHVTAQGHGCRHNNAVDSSGNADVSIHEQERIGRAEDPSTQSTFGETPNNSNRSGTILPVTRQRREIDGKNVSSSNTGRQYGSAVQNKSGNNIASDSSRDFNLASKPFTLVDGSVEDNNVTKRNLAAASANLPTIHGTPPAGPVVNPTLSNWVVTWTPPVHPNGGVIISYTLHIPGWVCECIPGVAAGTSAHKVLLLGLPIGRSHNVSLTILSLAGMGEPVVVSTPSSGSPLLEPAMALLLALCLVLAFVIAVLVVLIRRKDHLITLDDLYALNNPCYAPVAVEDDFILDPASVLIMESKKLGEGNFGVVVVGWLLKSKQKKPRRLPGIIGRRYSADHQSGMAHYEGHREDEAMALRNSVTNQFDMNDSRQSYDREDEVDDGVDGSGDSFRETEETDREHAMQELKKKKDWEKWRLHKKVAVKRLLNNIVEEPGESHVPTPVEKDILKTKFNREAGIMQHLRDSSFVVRFEGTVIGQEPMCILMELMDEGNLLQYITNPKNPITEEVVCNFGIQIADGMAYIASRRIIHIDLAARNVLMKGNIVKIADFGCSRRLKTESGYYHYQLDFLHRGRISLKIPYLLAPEARRWKNSHHFYLESDVWSYGSLLWEIATRASYPLVNEALPERMLDKVRQSISAGQPQFLVQLMERCWRRKPEDRPKFESLVEELLPKISPSFRRQFCDLSFHKSQWTRDTESTEDEGVASMPGSSRENIEYDGCNSYGVGTRPNEKTSCCSKLFSGLRQGSGSNESTVRAHGWFKTQTNNQSNCEELDHDEAALHEMPWKKKSNDGKIKKSGAAKPSQLQLEEATAFLESNTNNQDPALDSALSHHQSQQKRSRCSREKWGSSNRSNPCGLFPFETDPLLSMGSAQNDVKSRLHLPLNTVRHTPCCKKPLQMAFDTEDNPRCNHHQIARMGRPTDPNAHLTAPLLLPSTRNPLPLPERKSATCSFLAPQESYLEMSPKKINHPMDDLSCLESNRSVGSVNVIEADSNSDNMDASIATFRDNYLNENGECKACGYTTMNRNESSSSIDILETTNLPDLDNAVLPHHSSSLSRDFPSCNQNLTKFDCEAMIHCPREGSEIQSCTYANVPFKSHPPLCVNIDSGDQVEKNSGGSVTNEDKLSEIPECFKSSNHGDDRQSQRSIAFDLISTTTAPSPDVDTYSLVTFPSIDTLYPSASTCTSAVTSPCDDVTLQTNSLPINKIDIKLQKFPSYSNTLGRPVFDGFSSLNAMQQSQE